MNKFYTARNDKVFKAIMLDEDNKDILKLFLERILNTRILDLEYLQNELSINYPEERKKIVDILVKTEKRYIHIEMNNGWSSYLHNRNFCYFTNIYSKKTKAGEIYNLDDIFIHLDFTYHHIIDSARDIYKELEDNEYLRQYYVMDKTTRRYIDNFEIWEFNMDRVIQIWYSNGEERDKLKHLIMLDSDLSELNKISKGDELVEKFTKEIKELNENEEFTSWITPEEDERFILNTEKDISFKEGKAEGIEQGIEQEKISNAKKMKAENIDSKLISKVTGLSIEQIKKL